MEIWREEVFGPVLCVKTFSTEEEAIELANDSQSVHIFSDLNNTHAHTTLSYHMHLGIYFLNFHLELSFRIWISASCIPQIWLSSSSDIKWSRKMWPDDSGRWHLWQWYWERFRPCHINTQKHFSIKLYTNCAEFILFISFSFSMVCCRPFRRALCGSTALSRASLKIHGEETSAAVLVVNSGNGI